MKFSKPTKEEMNEVKKQIAYRARLSPHDRAYVQMPESTKGNALTVCYWSVYVLFQDRPHIFWLAGLAAGFQVFSFFL
jgi:hypothetical protein